ncbi:hypothetical protein OPT61_g10174 [Boeremia exigua]|uniref:Uncharacterized protein n=1 Tax=Boeremia exigua TaxID=749465 RepID=A0ACC2HRH7_9PLEO|nr:hypothetical protein OPT61_g10174 [Boeremia exigua]
MATTTIPDALAHLTVDHKIRRLHIGYTVDRRDVMATWHARNNKGVATDGKTGMGVVKTKRVEVARADWERIFPDAYSPQPSNGADSTAATEAGPSAAKKAKLSHEDAAWESWLEGSEEVLKKELRRIAREMQQYLNLKSIPDISILESMAEYRRLLGPRSSVMEAPAYLKMLKDLSPDSELSKCPPDDDDVSDTETIQSERTTKLIKSARDYKKYGERVFPTHARIIEHSEEHIAKIDKWISDWSIMLTPPPTGDAIEDDSAGPSIKSKGSSDE